MPLVIRRTKGELASGKAVPTHSVEQSAVTDHVKRIVYISVVTHESIKIDYRSYNDRSGDSWNFLDALGCLDY